MTEIEKAGMKRLDLGPTGRTVARNVKRVREGQDLTYAELARRVKESGHQISTLALRRIEAEARRVDVDDLVALAFALQVNPNALLLPATLTSGVQVNISGIGWLDPDLAWDWAKGERWAGDVQPEPLDPELTGIAAGRQRWRAEQLARELAAEEFQLRINPELVGDDGPAVRSISYDHTQYIGGDDGDR